jgi:ferrochelatase
LEWIGPSIDTEILRAGKDGKGVIVVPVAFVSEHSETLVELEIEYAKLAREHHVPDYIRVPAVRTHERFIEGLADLTAKALRTTRATNETGSRICPGQCVCGYGG